MGGLLVQDRDIDLEDRSEMEVVTERKPSEAEWGEMLFGWKVCKHVRSNAIVLVARPGLGRHRRRPDEPRRLRPARDREGARRRRVDSQGAALASDAFFPFADGPQARGRRRASPRSSSPAAPSATSRSSRPPTRRGSAWSSRTAGTSSTDALRASRSARSAAAARTATIVPATQTTPPDDDRERHARDRRDRAAARGAERRPDRVGELLDPREPAAHVVRDRLVPQRLAEDAASDMSAAPAAASATSASGSESASPKTTIAAP